MKDSFDLEHIAGATATLMPGRNGKKTLGSDTGRRPFRRRAALREAAVEPVQSAQEPQVSKTSGTGRHETDDGRTPLPAHRAPLAIDPVTLSWNSLRPASIGVRNRFLGTAPLVSEHREDPAARAFDLLRTRLLRALKANGWRRIAIAGPTPGCGATFTAVNLALSLARIPGSRSVLVDLDLRAPGIGPLLEMDAPGDIRSFLSGETAMAKNLLRVSDTLALGLASATDGDAAELLHAPICAEVLDDMVARLDPDVVIYDLPPVLAHDDLAAFLPQVDGVLLVADGTRTLARHIEMCERILDDQTRVLGVVLNRARRSDTRTWNA